APTGPDLTLTTVDTNTYEPLLGCTIGEIGSVAAGMHMCQGRAPLVPAPSATAARYRLVDTVVPSARDKDETSLFDGIDTSLMSLARFAGTRQPDGLVRGLAVLSSHVAAAREALGKDGPAATLPELVAGLAAVRGLRAELPSLVSSDDGRYEIDSRLNIKEEQFQDALILAHSLRIDATANDGLIVAGQPVAITVAVANRGPGEIGVRGVTLMGFHDQAACGPAVSSMAAPFSCVAQARIPAQAMLTSPYWERPENAGRAVFPAGAPFGLPFRPTPFTAVLELEIAGARVTHTLPVQFRYAGAGLVGEKRMELKVVPAFAVSVSPKIAVLPLPAAAPRASAASQSEDRLREVRVTVVNGLKGAASATVRLKTPAGWRVTPTTAAVAFTREDESVTSRFTVAPPAHVTPGDVDITAEVASAQPSSIDGSPTTFSTGYQVIEYPHIHRRHKLAPAIATLKVMDVAVAPALSVGYVMGVGDLMPPALQQLGARLTLLDDDELAWGDLAKYDAIVTGVRAYEHREDLKANNDRLLKYVENGGTVIVQYNKTEFNQAQFGPYPIRVSNNRVADELAPVTVLVPDHPVFNYPNKIGSSA
ncbi:MAG: NEW3 domain-containing protein, partial [Vicinamibacterales bacterium]